MLFSYPRKAEYGRVLPKNKIYEHARTTASLRDKFVKQVDRIVWAYKLSPETVNLRTRGDVPEIEVFSIALRVPEIGEELLRTIDTAIPFPIIYELNFNGRIKTKAAYKRASDADSGKWVTDIYFESAWVKSDFVRDALPVAPDLAMLYEQILRGLMPAQRKGGEDIRSQVARVAEIRSLETQVSKLQARIEKENQFNRKVELNAQMRNLKAEIAERSA